MKGEGMPHGSMDMTRMKEMYGRMMEMKKGMGDMPGMHGQYDPDERAAEKCRLKKWPRCRR